MCAGVRERVAFVCVCVGVRVGGVRNVCWSKGEKTKRKLDLIMCPLRLHMTYNHLDMNRLVLSFWIGP